MNRTDEQKSLWARFTDTGAVGAYLLYCAAREHESRQAGERGDR